MGYIAPIANYQYADYQKRVAADKRDLIHVERPFKVVLETQYEEVHDSVLKESNAHEFETEYSKVQNSTKFAPSYYNQAAIAAVTGKGQLFSGMV